MADVSAMLAKPADASDIETMAQAEAEIAALRIMLQGRGASGPMLSTDVQKAMSSSVYDKYSGKELMLLNHRESPSKRAAAESMSEADLATLVADYSAVYLRGAKTGTDFSALPKVRSPRLRTPPTALRLRVVQHGHAPPHAFHPPSPNATHLSPRPVHLLLLSLGRARATRRRLPQAAGQHLAAAGQRRPLLRRASAPALPLPLPSLPSPLCATIASRGYSRFLTAPTCRPRAQLIIDESLAKNEYPKAKLDAARAAEHTCLAAKCCTEEIFNKYKDQVSTGAAKWTIARAINSGTMYPHSFVGCHAGDQESWDDFKDFFYPVIEAYHVGFSMETGQGTGPDGKPLPPLQGTAQERMDPAKIGVDLSESAKEKIVSTRIRIARNLTGQPLPPSLRLLFLDRWIDLSLPTSFRPPATAWQASR